MYSYWLWMSAVGGHRTSTKLAPPPGSSCPPHRHSGFLPSSTASSAPCPPLPPLSSLPVWSVVMVKNGLHIELTEPVVFLRGPATVS